MSDLTPGAIRTAPLLLLWPTRGYHPGDFITVDDEPCVVTRILSDTGTVLRAELEVFPNRATRAKAWA